MSLIQGNCGLSLTIPHQPLVYSAASDLRTHVTSYTLTHIDLASMAQSLFISNSH